MNRLVFITGVFAAVFPLHGQDAGNNIGALLKATDLTVQGVDMALQGADVASLAADLASQRAGLAFQTLGNPVLQGVRVLDEGFGNQVVRGKPFSATEERHSLQTLGDGTRIENMQTNRLFRDADGRTRVEEMNGAITIYDPTTGSRVNLDPSTKTAHKGYGWGYTTTTTTGAAGPVTTAILGQAGRVSTAIPFANNPTTMQGVMSETTENLGTQAVNGVNAVGVRTTMVIPKGQIGNNKDIKVMTERWSSNDLQMLVKSVNSDPRFGENTYQLTKITQSAPDPALFQIPADYTVTEQPGVPYGRGGGRAAKAGPALPAPAQLKQ
jgi:hypothetical protein